MVTHIIVITVQPSYTRLLCPSFSASLKSGSPFVCVLAGVNLTTDWREVSVADNVSRFSPVLATFVLFLMQERGESKGIGQERGLSLNPSDYTLLIFVHE